MVLHRFRPLGVHMETGNELTAHITTGAVIVYAIQWAKSSGWFRWLSEDTKTLNRTVSALLAGAAAVGINWTYTAADGTLVITGLTTSGILVGGYEWLKQFCVQQLIFDTAASDKKIVVVNKP